MTHWGAGKGVPWACRIAPHRPLQAGDLFNMELEAKYGGYIAQTVQALKEINPDYIIPMHCSGAGFIRTVQREMPDKLIMSYTGSRYIFGA